MALVIRMHFAGAFLAATALAYPLPGYAYPFGYETVFLADAKLNPLFDLDSSLDDLMRLYRPTVYNRFHDNEFVYKQKEAETKPVLAKLIAEYDLKQPITINTKLNLGEYDFAAKDFPIVEAGTGYYFTASQSCCSDIPTDIKYYMTNWQSVSGMPASEELGKAIIGRRTGRTVEATISTLLESVAGDDELHGRITKVVFKDPAAGDKVLAIVDLGSTDAK